MMSLGNGLKDRFERWKARLMDELSGFIERYQGRIEQAFVFMEHPNVQKLAEEIVYCISNKKTLFLCGNGGSGSNANHIENDFLYGISKNLGDGLRCRSLSSNSAVISCLANDESFNSVFSYPLEVEATSSDRLLVLSGSGNSPNILEALKAAKKIGMASYALLGFDGGAAKTMCDFPIHIEVHDMQVAEDAHMMIAHIISQWIYENRAHIFKTGSLQ